MTTDEFYGMLATFIEGKTRIPTIWSHQQARNPNTGKQAPEGATAADMRKYVLISPGPQVPHSVHRRKDPKDITGVRTIDMIPIEIRFSVSGMECSSDELRPVWSLFIREDFKGGDPNWSILSVGTINFSPIYEKGEWKDRYVFECRGLIYDEFLPTPVDPIEHIKGEYEIFDPTERRVVLEGSFQI